MIFNRKTTVTQFMSAMAARVVDVGVFAELPKPETIGGVSVPYNLDGLTLGQLAALQQMKECEALSLPLKVVLDVELTGRLSALDVIGFATWVSRQMAEIALMFNSIAKEPTSEELRAGVNKLNFGVFGIADSYAQRMGIADHDYVLNCVSWLRVWQCMKNDADVAAYERRLRDIYSKRR